MNSEFDKTNQILRLIEEAGNIAILPSKTAGIDSFSSAVGLAKVYGSGCFPNPALLV